MWHRTVDFIKDLFQRVTDDDIVGVGAQLAFFLLLSLFPFLIFLMTLVGYLPLDAGNVTGFIERYAPGEISQLISENVNQLVNQQSGSLLSIGIIGTLWASSNGINAIMKGFNRAYEVKEDRSFIMMRLIAIGLTIAMVLVISMAFLLPVFGKMIGEYIFAFIGLSAGFVSVWNTLRWVVSSAVIFIVLLALYSLAPNMRISFKNVIWGALFSTIGWQLVSLAFSFYVNSIGNYSATYGSLGTVIVLMIWFYLTGIIIMVGGVINAMLRETRS
ncbi:YihY/virulence factor BrkB family protein [Lentibacillus salinarum]|uniref:YihY/virulence factor BrkB family protein n=1 Tax=Lentibacillus salinarum TaxID=446820 RepID=A0ABW3ZRT4_9BACI